VDLSVFFLGPPLGAERAARPAAVLISRGGERLLIDCGEALSASC